MANIGMDDRIRFIEHKLGITEERDRLSQTGRIFEMLDRISCRLDRLEATVNGEAPKIAEAGPSNYDNYTAKAAVAETYRR